MGNKIFNGVEGFSGFFEAFSGDDVTISFARGNATPDTIDTDAGFLVQSYTAQWTRPVTIDHVLNRKKPVALLGVGQGALQIQGLVGTPEGLAKIMQANELCEPLTAIIRGAANFKSCEGTGTGNKSCVITLGNVLPQGITVSGSSQNQGINLQSANASFLFGSMSVE